MKGYRLKDIKESSRRNTRGKIAVFAGTFDPLTLGHVDIVKRALRIFDVVYVAVLVNSAKTNLFTPEERIELIEAEFGSDRRVQVRTFSGLLVDFAQSVKATVVIRGLRAISDYDYEAQMALMNRNLCEDIETLFLVAREKYSYVSSSIVKQVVGLGGSVHNIISPKVERALKNKFSATRRSTRPHNKR